MPVLSLDVWLTNRMALACYRALGYRPESLCLIKALDWSAARGLIASAGAAASADAVVANVLLPVGSAPWAR